MDYHGIITKLIGPIEPVGETNEDEKRFSNLTNMTILVDRLVGDLDSVIPYRHYPEYSMKRAGEFADKFLTKLGISE